MSKILKFQGNNIFVYFVILLITFLGFIFRFYNINYENLWLDEIFSFWATDPSLSFTDTFTRVKSTESIPFLYFYLIKVCNSLFGYDPIIGRIFSAFFGFLSIFTVSNLCRKFVSNKSYLLTLCLTSLNIFLIVYSQEMRVYIFTFFLITTALVFFFNLYDEERSKILTKNSFLFSLFMLLAIFSHPFSIIVLGSLICFIFVDYIFFKVQNKKINALLTFVTIVTLFFLFHYLGYVKINNVDWIKQPGLKFFSNFYFSKFFGSRLLGIIHLVILIFLSFYLWKKVIKNKRLIFLYIMLFLSYFIPLVYGYFLKPIIFPKYIIFVLIPIILLISILTFYLEKKKIRNFFIIFLILLNFGNHFTESTFKQFFNERTKFKPDFDTAFKIVENSESNKVIFYLDNKNRETSVNQVQDYYKIVLLNYGRAIIKNNGHEIHLLNNNLKNYKGKIWNICLTIPNNKCYKPPQTIDVLNKNFLQGGLRLESWKIKR